MSGLIDPMQSEDFCSSTPIAPTLVLLPDTDVSGGVIASVGGGEPTLLGLGLMRRTILASARAGYSQTYRLAPDHVAQLAIPSIPDWRSLATALQHRGAPLVIAHSAIVGEIEWLKRLIATRIEPARWAAIPHRVVMLAAGTVPTALAVLDAEGAYDLTKVQDRLTHHFGAPAQVPDAIDPMAVATASDIVTAEQRLLR